MLKRTFKSVFKIVAILFVLGVFGIAAMLGLLWREHKSQVILPEPTGRFDVGRVEYTWAKRAKADESSSSLGASREVVVWIWYPAAKTASAKRAEYLPAAWRTALADHSGVLMSDFFTRDLALVRTHATRGPGVSPVKPSYPVVILRAGGGALTIDYTTLAEDLASHGYIVVGIDAPYRTTIVVLPGGRIIARPPEYNPETLSNQKAARLINRLLPMWTEDMEFVVTQLQRLNANDPTGRFSGRLDMQRLGVFGHSFGGAQALQFCHDDPWCKAGIDLDGAPYGSVVRDGLKQPFMFILSDHSHDAPSPANNQIRANLQSIYTRLPNGGYFITIRGANHFTFSDQLLIKSPLLITLMRIARFGRLGGRRGLAITAAYVHTFFDVYLKGAPRNLLATISAQYPKVEFHQR